MLLILQVNIRLLDLAVLISKVKLGPDSYEAKVRLLKTRVSKIFKELVYSFIDWKNEIYYTQ